jgi:uncharacterized protein with GYD domain
MEELKNIEKQFGVQVSVSEHTTDGGVAVTQVQVTKGTHVVGTEMPTDAVTSELLLAMATRSAIVANGHD